jgi:predicted ATP-dependent protease
MPDPISEQAAAGLAPAVLRRRCDPAVLPFETTADLAPPSALVGQERALEALRFGLAMAAPGFNVYVAGPPGTGKASAVRAFLDRVAPERRAPDDWCYVHNFHSPDRPRALRLPPGQGRKLRDGLRALVQAARREIPRAFESEEYIAGRESIVNDMNRRREEGIARITADARRRDLLVQPTPMGIAIVPLMHNRPVPEEEIANLRPEMREQIRAQRAAVEAEVSAFLKDMRRQEREARARMEAQDRDLALNVIGGVVEDLAEHYDDQQQVAAYLDDVREGILADLALFRGHPLPADGRALEPAPTESPEHVLHERAFRKYEVNVVIDNGGLAGAPVVTETNPTYPNLVGRCEREVLFGALMTDFTLITPGALHRANGGYLVLRVADLLRTPLAWDGLKRALRERELAIEDAAEALGLTETRALRPDPIPLDVKVVLLGELLHYQLLYALDPDFRELVKVRADFDTLLERTPGNEIAYAASLAAGAAPLSVPLDREAVALLIEEASRLAQDQRKLSLHFGRMIDLVREAEHLARTEGAPAIGGAHVRRVVALRRERAGLLPERLRELTARGVLAIRPEGAAIGQVHGLSVIQLGDSDFGRPVRITATVGAGRDGVLDIERQVELGGRIHSKGVHILSGYLTDSYARDKPLALSARLVFEQSYEEVEGDSASLAELLTLLSRLADVPLRQGIAVTGSVNQRGEVQAVGGVNEKIEGFFDTCAATGLTGEQGAILPASNVEHLMLREDVVEAVAAGRFHIYAVRSVDDALEVLSGMPAGPRAADGSLPAEGLHARVDAGLRHLAEALRAFSMPEQADGRATSASATAAGDGRRV